MKGGVYMTYQEFINNVLQTRGRFACGEEYHERHHITPRCMDGNDDEENLIDLFAREHFIAHKLLALENPENDKFVYAWWCMCTLPGSSKKRIDITAQDYEEARKKYAEKFSGDKNPSSKRIIRLCDDKIYNTARECYIDNNISNTTLCSMLKQYRNFMYYDEWIRMPEQKQNEIKSIDWGQIEHANRSMAAKKAGNGGSVKCSQSTKQKISLSHKGKYGTKVYCPELDEEFMTMKEASDKYGVNKTSIGYCLCGKQKHAGKHPVTGEPLSWVKLENKNS
jgi:predicted metal-binding transcription factor (methanogenesis marker protein 9)